MNYFSIKLLTILFSLLYHSESISDTIAKTLQDSSLKSVENRDIKLVSVPVSGKVNIKNPRYLYIQAGLHGNETATSSFVEWLIRRTKKGKSLLNQLPPNTTIDFVPKASPDTWNKSRYNSNQINLNRNFAVFFGISTEPTGSAPFSEPETKAIKKLFEKRNYISAVDIHGYVNWIVTPSKPTAQHMSDKRQIRQYHRWKKQIASLTKTHLPHYALQEALALGDGGAFEDWAFWERKSLAFCMEMNSKERLRPVSKNKSVDTWKEYEVYLFKVFSSALSISEEEKNQLAEI